MRWFENPHFDFVGKRRIALVFSAILIIAAIVGLFTTGLKFGIQFKGGKEFVLQFQKPANVAGIRDQLTKPLDGEPLVKQFGGPETILIRTDAKGSLSSVRSTVVSVMQKSYPNNAVKVERTDVVGPRFAKDLRNGAVKAIIFAIIVIFIYILIRFKNWRMSVGATIALAHDVLIVIGIYALFHSISPFNMEIDETMIAAFLTIVGYSINDTVIIFDRVREYLNQRSTKDYMELVNISLNDTLSRTIVTALTVFFTVTVLFFFGGQTLKGFAFGMMMGTVFGTYSSIFVATGIAVELHLWKPEKENPTKKRKRDRRKIKQYG
jgi:preprotein translocase subunit SecF